MCCCNKFCLCVKITFIFKKILTGIKNYPFYIAAILFGFFGFVLLYHGFSSKLDLFAGSAAVVAIAALMFSAGCYQVESRKKSSSFYLNNIKECLKEAVLFIEEGKNSNTKWHQAIRSLMIAVELSSRLTEDFHKEIYLNDFINTAFSIVNKISTIDSFKFFYGVADYITQDEISLYQISNPPPSARLNRVCPRVLPEALAYLSRFIDKANSASYDNERNGTSLIRCFNSEYFLSPITRALIKSTESTIRDLAGIPTVIQYMDSYESCQNQLTRRAT